MRLIEQSPARALEFDDASGAPRLALVGGRSTPSPAPPTFDLLPLTCAQSAAATYLLTLSSNSQRIMASDLRTLVTILIELELADPRCTVDTLPWGQLRYDHTVALRAALAERYALNTARRMVATLRGVLKAARRLKQMTADDYADAIDLPRLKGKALPKGRALSEDELRALFAVCAADNSAAGVRDAALLAVLVRGLRRAEASALRLDDYDRERGELMVRRGKGNKDRLVPLGRDGRAALDAWLTRRGDAPGPLFLPRWAARPGRKLRRLSAQSIMDVVIRRAAEAGVNRVTPHVLRRTCVTNLLSAGADALLVQGIVGHESLATTKIYDQRGPESQRAAVERLPLPIVAPAQLRLPL